MENTVAHNYSLKTFCTITLLEVFLSSAVSTGWNGQERYSWRVSVLLRVVSG